MFVSTCVHHLLKDADEMIVGVLDDIEQSENPNSEKFQPSEALSRIGLRLFTL